MAFFGAPIQRDDHARRAVETAGEILREVMNPAAQLGLRVGAGISSGEAFVGNVGGADVADYTVLGDTVNVAARLSKTPQVNSIVVGERTYEKVKGSFKTKDLGEMALKGKEKPQHAYEIVL